MGTVLLTDGHVRVTAVANRADRRAVLNTLAHNHPVFGFALVFDAFLHAVVNGPSGKRTESVDVLMAQIGTRDLRVMRRRPYRRVKGRAVFETPPPEDVTWNPPGGAGTAPTRGDLHIETDPYAGLFLTVPTSSRAQ